MIRRNKWQLIISSVIILLPVVAGLFIWNYLPEQIATHWGVDGEANGWSGKSFTVFVIPLIMLAIHWICVIFTVRDPKNKEQSSKVFNMVLWFLPVTSLVVCGFNYAIVLGNDVNIIMMVRVLLGILFVIFGNYMPKCRKNSTIGIKVIWALRNEENWNKTHQFTGKLWVIGGLLILATLLIPAENLMYVLFPLILFMAFAPMIYSYTYYRKQLKAGTATKEDAVQTPYEKKMTTIALIVVIVVLTFAAIFLFPGKFEVKFNETSFTIETACWDDATINYADIDNIEWREQNIKGIRTFGYGTPFIVMGECENAEFGKYTGYTYTSCDAGVVLSIGDKILVINGKNEEDTKAIYDELTKRIFLKMNIKPDHKTFDVPDVVVEEAEELITGWYLYEQANNEEYSYTDWRIESLEHCYTYDDFEGMVLQIYQLNHEFLSDKPENILLAGGMSVTDDGWVTPGYPNSRFLVFRQDGETLSLLVCLSENDCFPGDELFSEDLKNLLEDMEH